MLFYFFYFFVFFQAEDGIRDLVRSRGLGDVYKRQIKMILALSKIRGTLASELAVLIIDNSLVAPDIIHTSCGIVLHI